MFSWIGAQRLQREARSAAYSIRVAIVLSLMFSLAAIAIISKKHHTNVFWGGVAAFAAPLAFSLYFRNRIVLLGGGVYVAALIAILVAAILFGI